MENSNENPQPVTDQPPSPPQPHEQESTRDEGLHPRVDDTRDEEEPEQQWDEEEPEKQWDEDYDEDDENPPDYEGDYTYADEDSVETPEPQWLQPQRRPQQQQSLAQRRQQHPVRVQQDDTQPAQSGGGDKRNPLKLRLDLNLAVDIELKARIHGDLTLALLEGL